MQLEGRARAEGGKTEEEEVETGRSPVKQESLGFASRLLLLLLLSPAGPVRAGESGKSELCSAGAMAAFPGVSGSCGLAWPRSPPASALGWEPMLGLQIRSRSVEQTLVPLVAQVTSE